MLVDAMDVGGRVFQSRPNDLVIEQLPAVCVYFDTEPVNVSEGGNYIPHAYERALQMTIDVIAEQPNDPDNLDRAEDILDSLARSAEVAIGNDYRFQARLDGYNNNLSDAGLLMGSRLTNVEAVQVDTADRTIVIQSLSYELLYEDHAFEPERMRAFESYLIKINRVGWDGDTVDPTLIGAEGDVT